MTPEKTIDFPPLPNPTWVHPESMGHKWDMRGGFTEQQMRDYVEADRAQRQAEQPTPAYTCVNAGTEGGACKQHCGDTARCWGNTTIALRPEAIDRAYRTVWATVAHDYRLTAFAHEIVAEYKAQQIAAQVPGALSDEQDRALCEAHCNLASGDYFLDRPQLDSAVNRRIFHAGHRKGWIEKAAHRMPAPPPAAVQAPAPDLCNARIAALEAAENACDDLRMDPNPKNRPGANACISAIRALIAKEVAAGAQAVQPKPVGYVAAAELSRLNSGHDANMRSARFGPSPLDGDVPVYLAAQAVQP